MPQQTTSYSLTIPHSSNMVHYKNFLLDCPPDSTLPGAVRCKASASDSKDAGWHYTNPDAEDFVMVMRFTGTSFYLYGSVVEGIEYHYLVETIAAPEAVWEGVGKLDGDLLLKIEGMSLGPRDVTVTAKRRTDAGKLSFSHAVVEVDTKSKEDLATATYSLDDPTVVNLSAGWKKNGSYWVADADNSISFNWIGHSIAVYGQCTSADEFIGTWPRIDGLISLGPDIDRKIGQYIVDDCLMHYFTWKLLVPTSHNYTWPTGGRPLRLNRIVVTEFGALLPFDEQLSHDDKTLSAGEIAGIAVGSAFLVALVTLIVFWLRRRNLLAANRSSRTIPVEPTPLQINASETPRELKSAAQFMPSLAAEPGSPSSPSYDPYAEFQPSSQGR